MAGNRPGIFVLLAYQVASIYPDPDCAAMFLRGGRIPGIGLGAGPSHYCPEKGSETPYQRAGCVFCSRKDRLNCFLDAILHLELMNIFSGSANRA